MYVDDLLITGSSLSLVEEAKGTLKSNFKLKDLGAYIYNSLELKLWDERKGLCSMKGSMHFSWS